MDMADFGGLLARSEALSGARMVQSSMDLDSSQYCSVKGKYSCTYRAEQWCSKQEDGRLLVC